MKRNQHIYLATAAGHKQIRITGKERSLENDKYINRKKNPKKVGDWKISPEMEKGSHIKMASDFLWATLETGNQWTVLQNPLNDFQPWLLYPLQLSTK